MADEAPLPSGSGGARPGWLLPASLLVFSAALLLGLDRAGRSARVVGEPRALSGPGVEVVLVRTNAEAVATWKARGLRGRVLLHAGRFLHFVPGDEQALALEHLTAPGSGPALDEALLREAGARDHLRVAADANVARRILYFPPPASLASRLAALEAAHASLPLEIPSKTRPRTLLATLPRLDEPVLVEVNASWFDEGSAADLLAALRGSGLRSDLVVASLAEDAEDVSAAAREALRGFARDLAGGAREGSP